MFYTEPTRRQRVGRARGAAAELRHGSIWLYCAARVMAKYKMKTNSSVKKRFKVTGSGKIKRKRGYLRHNLTHKTSDVKRKLRRGAIVHESQAHQIRAMIPYGLP